MLSSLKYYRNTLFLQTQNKRLLFLGVKLAQGCRSLELFQKNKENLCLEGATLSSKFAQYVFFVCFLLCDNNNKKRMTSKRERRRTEEDGGGRRVTVRGNTE